LPPLGVLLNYGLFANVTIGNSGFTIVSGNVGAGTSIIGFPPGMVIPLGVLVSPGNSLNFMAYSDLLILSANLSAQGPPTVMTGTPLAGLTLIPGVYFWATSAVSAPNGVLTLDAQNNTDAVWVIQITDVLLVDFGSRMVIINGGSPCNVFWIVGESTFTAFTGAVTQYFGTIVAGSTVVMGGDIELIGAVFSIAGSITTVNAGIVPCCEDQCSCPVCGSSSPMTTGFIG